MKKLLGAVLVLFASLWAAVSLIRRQKTRRADLLSLEESLRFLKRELGERLAPLRECFSLLAEKADREPTRCFYLRLCEKMSALGEKRFSEIWKETVLQKLSGLDSREREALLPLGRALEGCETSELCAELEKAADSLEAFAARIEEKESENRRLALGLSLSAGAFIILVLI